MSFGVNGVITRSAEQVFTEIVEKHMNDVYRFSLYMLGSNEDAQDITSDTFMSLHESLGKLDVVNEPVKPWLIRVAKNKCLDLIKKKKNVPFSNLEDEVIDIPDTDPDLEAQFDSNEFINKVKGFITELPENARQVLLLKYFEEYTFAEIAETTEMSENTVKSLFYRGQARLYKQLKAMEVTK